MIPARIIDKDHIFWQINLNFFLLSKLAVNLKSILNFQASGSSISLIWEDTQIKQENENLRKKIFL